MLLAITRKQIHSDQNAYMKKEKEPKLPLPMDQMSFDQASDFPRQAEKNK